MSEATSDYLVLKHACEINGMVTELEAYENLLMVGSFYANAAKAVLRSRIAETNGFGDEFVQVTCEQRVPIQSPSPNHTEGR